MTPSLRSRRRFVACLAGSLMLPTLALATDAASPAEPAGAEGVDTVAALPGVGANLTDHYQMRVAARLKDIRTVNERGRGLPLLLEIATWGLGSRGTILGMGAVPMRVFMRSDPAMDAPDLQLG